MQAMEEASNGEAQLFALLHVVVLNSVAVPGGGKAVYATASKANHSCHPNAAFRIEHLPLRELRLVALRDIQAGEEVLVSYLQEEDLLKPRRRRRKQLRNWGFTCCCRRCLGSDDVRTFLCPQCGVGGLQPVTKSDGKSETWLPCSFCGAEAPPGEAMVEAEAFWKDELRGKSSAKDKKTKASKKSRAAVFVNLLSVIEEGRQRRSSADSASASNDATSNGKIVPSLEGHWLASRIARKCEESLLWKGDYELAAEAARWRWRFVKKTFMGCLSRLAAESLAARAAAAATACMSCTSSDTYSTEERAELDTVARRRYAAALREVEALLPEGDELLAQLRLKKSSLKLAPESEVFTESR
eukprot:TRINITY_DN40477_c0_g1_i1.p1 TRINITY_DN40477_c0_g1~~TRINITY_DN40477_c0_g1_i1.p1  ORF type:complete len:357 (-),score=91.22 TRINITY_DN40477_c0_g1_i1:140-1210(-)